MSEQQTSPTGDSGLMTLQDVCRLTGFLPEEVLGCWQTTRQTAPIGYRLGRVLVYPRVQVEAWMRHMGLTPKPALATGPIECVPWCVWGEDGHGDAVYKEDQSCGGEMLRVPLSLEPLIGEDGVVAGESRVDRFDVYAWRPGPDGELEVRALRGSTDRDIRFSAAEAQQLVEALQLVLGQISATAETGR